ncbi:MAG: glutaredoxin family protein [Candidatus Freyarchaeota archaeon]|nr:glutaredoxin family protein [Candidatus Jordarchaeia archaeon]MBS7267234.1 glutaredoxin family protein [Candidatus Jordarchaeia archaeon]MBS7278441.1 glutaredoxin family protein [Candidatus Jordarchaeia archaeon]
MDVVKVSGSNRKHKVRMYALSTCIWCKRTKQFLKDNNIEYEYVDVDLASREDYEQIRQEILDRGGSLSFPVIIIDDNKLINGFRESDLREALEI